MLFRPYPVLTLLAIPILAILLWLGGWQSQRAGWKQRLIDTFEAQAALSPRDAAEALCSSPDVHAEHIVLSGDSVRALRPASQTGPVRMFGPNAGGVPGWSLLVPVEPPTCPAVSLPVIIETGFEVLQAGPQPPVSAPAVADRFIITPWPAKPAFAAHNDALGNDWHWFDASAIASALGVPAVENTYYLKMFSGQLPAHLSRTPPATHIGYAATWYGMALALIVIYAAFHMRAGRLRFGKGRTGDAQ